MKLLSKNVLRIAIFASLVALAGCTTTEVVTTPAGGWHCIAHDSPPGNIAPKTWFYNAPNKQTAIDKARSECNRNSRYGRCYVARGSCTRL